MGKFFLLEVKSLIDRIENPETLNESKVGFRFIDKAENLPDLLAGLKPGKMFTFGYVNVAQIVVPTVKRKNPETNRMKSYEDYAQLGKNLGEEGDVVNVIKLSMYNFPWQEQNRVKQRYSDWRTKRDELAGRFGVTYGKARYGTEMNNFGGGIESYKGNNPELSDHTYLNFNLHNIYPFSTTYYLLFSDGSIKQVDEKKLEFKAKNSYDELQKLRDAGATEADLECLLGMNYHKFENSKILFVSGTEMDGVPTLLINDHLSDKISGIAGVNRDAIVQIAKDRYSKVLKVNEGKDAVFYDDKEKHSFNNRTKERQPEYEITHDEIKKIASILENEPIEEKYKPVDFGFCKIQRINGNELSGRSSILKDENGSITSYCYENGAVILQIGGQSNIPWYEENGYTYMAWKE